MGVARGAAARGAGGGSGRRGAGRRTGLHRRPLAVRGSSAPTRPRGRGCARGARQLRAADGGLAGGGWRVDAARAAARAQGRARASRGGRGARYAPPAPRPSTRRAERSASPSCRRRGAQPVGAGATCARSRGRGWRARARLRMVVVTGARRKGRRSRSSRSPRRTSLHVRGARAALASEKPGRARRGKVGRRRASVPGREAEESTAPRVRTRSLYLRAHAVPRRGVGDGAAGGPRRGRIRTSPADHSYPWAGYL